MEEEVMKKWTNLWLSALLIACLLAFAPAALMEETPPEEAADVELDAPVEEQTFALGEETELELTDEAAPAEVESEAVEAVQAQEGIPIDEDYFPDEGFRNYITMIIDKDHNDYLDQSEIDATDTIWLNFDKDDMPQEEYDFFHEIVTNEISSIGGIEYFTNLEYLYAYDMPNLEEIDVSQNTKLKILKAWDDPLYYVDVSGCPKLTELYVGSNGLEELDVTNNPALEVLNAYDCDLWELDVSNCPRLEYLNVYKNDLTELDISNNKDLQYLYADENHLSALDISNNKALKVLYAQDNEMTGLTIGNNSELATLCVGGNHISTLNVTNCPKLLYLYVEENELTALDVSNNPVLEELGLWKDHLTALDVSRNPKLRHLHVGRNELTTLDVSHNDELEILRFEGNHLKTMDPSNCAKLYQLVTYENQLTSLLVNPAAPVLKYMKDQYRTDNDEIIEYMHETDDITYEFSFDKNVKVTAGETLPSVPVTKNASRLVYIGDRFRIVASGATDFKSSKPAIAEVSATGVVTAKTAGKANITFKLGKKKITLKLTVNDPTIPTGLTLNVGSKIDHDYNKDLYLTCKPLPEGKAQSEIEWKTSSAKIATVTNGVVHPLKVGKVTITATAKKNKKASAKVVINIYDPKLPTGITLDKTGTVKMDLSETLTLHASIIPATAESPIEWKSSSPKIATVKDGVVTPVKAGSVTITATPTKIKKSAKVKIVISDMHAPKSVSFKEGKNYTLKQGESITLNPVVTGETGYEPRINLTWQNGDKKGKVITFNEATRTVTAVGPGTAKITVTTDNKKKATISIKVPK